MNCEKCAFFRLWFGVYYCEHPDSAFYQQPKEKESSCHKATKELKR